MYPRLYTWEPYFTLHTYGVLMALAVFAGLYVAVRWRRAPDSSARASGTSASIWRSPA
jgi:prolipoprotein diacylglyceryltransferase